MPLRAVERLPATELAEWRAYYELEPFGAWRDNFHAALICTEIARAFRSSESGRVDPMEFFFENPDEKQRRKDQQMIAWLDANMKVVK